MQQKESQFDILSKTLEPEERNILLKKIKDSNKTEEDEIKRREIESRKQKQYKYVQNIIKSTDFISRFIIWVISLFSGKKKEDVVLNRMYNDLKRDIILKSGYIVDFRNEIFTKNFAEEILSLAETCTKVESILNYFFKDQNFYINFICWLIEQNFSDDIKDAMDSLEPENFKLTTSYIDRNDYNRERDRRINNFLQKVTMHSNTNINKFFMRMDIMLLFVNFDFKSLLYEFAKRSDDNDITKSEVHFFMIEDLLERLYVLLATLDFGYEDIILIEEMIEYSDIFYKEDEEIKELFTDKDLDNVKYLFNIVNNFKNAIPLDLLFQYFKKDILFSVKPLKVKVNVVNMYKDHVRKVLINKWSTHYEKLGEINIKKALQELFKNYDDNALEYFNLQLKKIIDEKSHVKLKNVRKINFIINFLEKIYKTDIEKAINKILINGNFTKDVDRTKLATNYYLLHNFTDKIREFDENLDTESDLGRKISTFTKISVGNIDFAKTLQNTVSDINNSTTELLDEVFNALWTINELVMNLSDKSGSKNVILLNFEELRFPGYMTSFQGIEAIKDLFEKFFKIYNQINEY